MNPSEKNKLYQKYLEGEISREEMHRLNQYALEDDFLFDAIEGAAEFETSNKSSIAELKSRLEAKQDRKRRPLFLWMGVAATIAILIFAITFIPSPKSEVLSDAVETSADKEQVEAIAAAEQPMERDFSPAIEEQPKADEEKNKKLITRAATTQEEVQQEDVRNEIANEPAPLPEPSSPKQKAEIAKTDILEVSKCSNELDHEVKEEVVVLEESESVEKPIPAAVSAPKPLGKSESGSQTENTSERNSEFALRAAKKKPLNNFSREREKTSTDRDQLARSDDAAGAILKFMELEVLDDAVNTLTIEKYLTDALEGNYFPGEFIANFRLENGRPSGEIEIVKSIRSSFDDRLVELIERFEDWEGDGNKTIKILFR